MMKEYISTEYQRGYQKKRYRENREQCLAYQKDYYEKHREQCLERSKKWSMENDRTEYFREYHRKRKAKQVEAV
jgi:hypothetical protein